MMRARMLPGMKHHHAVLLLLALGALWLAREQALAATAGSEEGTASPAWVETLQKRLEAIDAAYPGELGVYVHDLDSDASVSLRADQPWYLASGVKVPVAIAVIRAVENGELTLDSRIVLEADDFVDGAGRTNSHPAGTPLRVDYLIEQMLIVSDNTATDVLIRTVGLERVNAVAAELMSETRGPITTLGDVRRHVYSTLHANAFQLTGNDLLALRRAAMGKERVERLAQLLRVPSAEFLLTDLDSAFEAYYATNLNTASLQDYGRMLIAVAEGQALAPEGTGYLLDVLSRVVTGDRRIKAGLPGTVVFAHKTGTQHRRICDLGLALGRDRTGGQRVVIAACSRGAVSLARSEQALRDVGRAVAASGLLTRSPAAKHER